MGRLLLTTVIGLAISSTALAAPKASNSGCGNKACHKKIFRGKVVHGPLSTGSCTACHPPRRGKMPKGKHAKGTFSTSTDSKVCLSCHRDVDKELRHGKAHKPVTRDGCLKCHKPHSTNTKFLLKGSSIAEQCAWCHKGTKKKYAFTHGPVAAGACTFCHSPHGSKNKTLLTATGAKLCFGCHEADRFKNKFNHKALKKGCTSCHDPHGGSRKYFVRKDASAICAGCHQKIIKEASSAKFKHAAIEKAGCVGCHDPHGSKYAHLIKKHPLKVCTGCHEKVMKNGKKKHGPVQEGDCGACHRPHGSQIAKLLKKDFPADFYGPFSVKRYTLCFDCHEAEITKSEHTTTLTDFRDGKRNMHYLHVVAPGGNTRKGRSCKACHQVHAGPQAKHIREEVPFGRAKWMLPVKYTKEKNGGSCVVGCHSPKKYSRSKK